MNVSIKGSGSYIPPVITPNNSFLTHEFLQEDGTSFDLDNAVIIEKFKAITGIVQRRYAPENMNTSDLGFLAAKAAIEDAGIDSESLDYIIFGHNFGDVSALRTQGDTLPSLASRVKNLLRIKNPNCVAYDLLFGCPGWVEGVIHAQAFMKAGMAKRCLVIGGETLSRVLDPYDRDSMIYADGAGAVVLEVSTSDGGRFLSHATQSHTLDEAHYLFFGGSYKKEAPQEEKYIKMYGRKIYEFAVTHVPVAMKKCLDESGVAIQDLKKIFIHQANEKMDAAIVKRFYKNYQSSVPEGIMPMNIHEFGNSSVATIPTLYDMVKKGQLEGHELSKGDVIMFASVGAGMNINACVYQV
jgi:3-oxoacyl-[acyl-carrier-protein] synthase-3